MKVKYQDINKFWDSNIDYVECDSDTGVCRAVINDGTALPCPCVDFDFAEKAVVNGAWKRVE